MAKVQLIYWDSCVFIDAIQQDKPERLIAIRPFIAAAEKGELKIVTSTFSKAEVCKLKGLGLLPDDQEKKLIEFFDNDYITVRPVDDEVAEKARQIIRFSSPGLKPPDAIQVATAVLNQVSLMHSYDVNVVKNSGVFDTLKIENPTWRGQVLLPEVEHETTASAPLALVPKKEANSR